MFSGPPVVVISTALPRFQSLLFTLLRWGFQTVACCVLGTWFEGGGFTHFHRGGVAVAQGRTSPTLRGRKNSVYLYSSCTNFRHLWMQL